jgi:hypothetical protein
LVCSRKWFDNFCYCSLGLDFGSEEEFETLPDRSQLVPVEKASTSRGSVGRKALPGSVSESSGCRSGVFFYFDLCILSCFVLVFCM